MNIVLNIDGVLRDESGVLKTDGLLLYKIFKSACRVVLITSMSLDMTTAWLAMNHVSDYDDIIPVIPGLDGYDLTIRQIEVARSQGEITYYVDADPTVVTEALRQGIGALLFVSPVYGRPEFRPDAPKGFRKSWSEITEEKNKQLAMKAADNRLNKQFRFE
jgi:hypothetical protein